MPSFPNRTVFGRPPAPPPVGGAAPYLGQSILPANEASGALGAATAGGGTIQSTGTYGTTVGAQSTFNFQPQNGAMWIERLIAACSQGGGDTTGIKGLASLQWKLTVGGVPIFPADKFANGMILAYNAIDAELVLGEWIDPVVQSQMIVQNLDTVATSFMPAALGQYARGIRSAAEAFKLFGFGGVQPPHQEE